MRSEYRLAGQSPSGDQLETYTGTRRKQQVTAWIVLCAAFAIFWVLVIGSFLGAKRYYDVASVAHSATLSLERGIVLFRDAVSSSLVNAHDSLILREGDELQVGEGARASLILFDGSKVLLYSGTETRFDQLRQSRFHDGFTRVGLHVKKGTVRLYVGNPVSRAGWFKVSTPHGSALLAPGDFGVEVSNAHTRISSRTGTASALSDGEGVEIRPGEKALLDMDGVVGPLPEGDSLVANGDFSQGYAQWNPFEVSEPGRYYEPGQRMLTTQTVDGQPMAALRLLRVSQRSTHNETGLSQPIGKDVSDYRSLVLDVDVRVDEQSLSGGGYMGWEYPVMVRIRYRDAGGGQTDWVVGFFHKNPENRPTPNGEGVPQSQWVHFSYDLMKARPLPSHLVSIEVLGAGHSFDGMIAQVGLVGK